MTHGSFTKAGLRWIHGNMTAAVLLLVIAAGAGTRLYYFRDPWLPPRHWWRQYDTAAIARNFYNGSMNILYPQVDWRGNSPGYVEAEFQIYTWLVAVVYRLIGPYEWLGRFLNVVFYALSALVLFLLVKRLYSEVAGLFAAVFYSIVPLTFLYTQTFQPDALLCFCSLLSVYWFLLWIEGGRSRFLAFSAVALSIAVLIKPYSLYLGLPLAYLCYRRFGWRLFRTLPLWLFAAVAVIPAVFWYLHAYQLWAVYGNTFGVFAGQVKIGAWSLADRRWLGLAKRLCERTLFELTTIPGLPLLLAGALVRPQSRNYLFHWWPAGFLVTVIALPAGHYAHDYYQLPAAFFASVYMGCAMDVFLRKRFLKPIAIALCALVLVFSIRQNTFMLTIQRHSRDRFEFGNRVRSLTPPGSLVVFAEPRLYPYHPEYYQHRTFNGEFLHCDPIDFYFSARKGWSIDGVHATPTFIETLRRRGAQYFATFYPSVFIQSPYLRQSLDERYRLLESTGQWVIYKLD